MVADNSGDVYVIDTALNRIRRLAAGCVAAAQPIARGVVPSPGLPASGQAPFYAPGELISIYGAGLGPVGGVGPVLDQRGFVPTTVGGVRVLFEGIPGPVLYSSNGQVNAIVPGWIWSEMTAPVKDTALYQEIILRTPAGRFGEPEEMAGAAVFLASRASDFITGSTVFVDGGYAIR